MKKFLLAAGIFCATLSNNAFSQASNTLDNLGLTSSTPAQAAYSLNKLSSAYTGAAIQVRRSSDNTTQDISFGSGGKLDTVALKAFVGSDNGYVTIWYDQSGNERNLTQTDGNRQPTIVHDGVVYRRNGLPTLYHDQNDDGLIYTGADYMTSTPLTVNTVAGSNSSNGGARRAIQGVSNWLIGPYGNNDGWHADGWNYYYSGNPWSLSRVENYTVIEPVNDPTIAWRDGALQPMSGNVKGVPIKLNTATGGAYFEPLDGYISELLGFNIALSDTERLALEQSQKVMYGIVSSNAALANLIISDGTLTPAFSTANTTYTSVVDNPVTNLKVTPTGASADATMEAQVNGGGYTAVTNGAISGDLPLNTGANTVEVKSTAPDGTTTQTYTITVNRAPLPPTVQASNISTTNTGALATNLNWTNGDGEYRAVFVAETLTGSPAPEPSTTYTANPIFKTGTQIGSTGWYCVYKGTETSVDLLGLKANTGYRVMVIEFNGGSGVERFLTTAGTNNPINVTTTGLNTLDKLGLDNTVNSTGAAYALRLLSSAYAGPLARVFIDGSYYDVYPDASGDKAFSLTSPISAGYSNYNDAKTGATANTLSTIVSAATNASVAIWYDQSANGIDAIQDNISSQPGIINAGDIYKENGKPAIKFNASAGQNLISAKSISISYGSTANAVAQSINSTGNAAIIGQGLVNDQIGFHLGWLNSTFSYNVYVPGWQQSAFTYNNPTAPLIVTGTYGNNAVNLFVNRIQQNAAGANPNVAVTSTFYIGTNWDRNQFFDGYIPEVTLFTTAISTTDRQAIEASQYTYFNLGLPYAVTNPVGSIKFSGVTLSGKVVSDFDNGPTTRGFVYGTSADPTLSNTVSTDSGNGLGDFTTTVTGLPSSTLYHFRAYATNSVGTSYGEDQTFTTLPPPNAFDKLGLTNTAIAESGYAMRLLSSTYAGPLVRIQIANTFYDVYPDASADKNFSLNSQISQVFNAWDAAQTGATTAQLNSIVSGATEARVVTWYDQTGYGNDAVQTDQNRQPQIIDGGAINTEHGRPALKFASDRATLLYSKKKVEILNASSVNAVAQNINTPQGGYQSIICQAHTGGNISFMLNHQGSNMGYMLYNGGFPQATASPNVDFPLVPFTATGTYGGNTINFYLNGVEGNPANTSSNISTDNPLYIGARWDSGESFDGYIAETMVFSSEIAPATRQSIETNQIAHYNIGGTGVLSGIGTLVATNTYLNTPSANNTLTVSGTDLIAPLIVTPPKGFEASIDNTTFAPSVTVGTTSTVAATPVYIRLAATSALGNYPGKVVVSSIGTSSVMMAIPSSSVSPVPNFLDKAGLATTDPATGAYAMRLLSSTYTGPLTRIYLNGSYYDVYPDASADKAFSLTSPVSAAYNNYNDEKTGVTSTLLNSIIGTNSATIAVWYDQGGQANDAVQESTGNQPQIINNALINKLRDRPAPLYSGGQWLNIQQAFYRPDHPNAVVNIVYQNTVHSGNQSVWGADNGGWDRLQLLHWGGTGNPAYGLSNGGGTISTPATDTFDQIIYSAVMNYGTTDGTFVAVNGVDSAPFTESQGDGTGNIAIGAVGGYGGFPMYGNISEFTLFFNAVPTGNRHDLEANQTNYYRLTYPTVVTNLPTALSTTTATLTGEATADAGHAITVKGVVYGKTPNPTIDIDHVANGGDGIGAISVDVINLEMGTGYHYRAFATTSEGTSYGDDKSFLTKSSPNMLDSLGLTAGTIGAGTYSLRLLSSTYTGPLTRINVNGTYYDVYPDATTRKGFSLTSPISTAIFGYNEVNAPATTNLLSSIIGSNSATVAIWYDQSGKQNDGIQQTTNMQPEIINTGVINVDASNNLPAIQFNGGKNLIVTSTDFNEDLSGSLVYNATADNTSSNGPGGWYTMNGIFGSEQGGDTQDFGYGILNGRFTAGFGGGDDAVLANTAISIGSAVINSWTRNSANGYVNLYNNAAADGSKPLASGNRSAVPSISIGSIQTFGGGGVFYHGTISEMALFPVVYSDTEKQAIEQSQATYYNISINTAPTAIALSATAIDENVAAESAIGTFTTTDIEGGSMTYTLVSGTGDDDNAAFTIVGDTLKINASPDFETKNSYSVLVRVTDGGSLSFDKQFTISINDLAEVVVNETSFASTAVDGNYSEAVTASGGTAPYTFALTAGELPAGLSIAANDGDATISGHPTTAGTFNFTITATDANDFTGSKAFSIVVAAGTPAITYAATASKIYGDADFDPAASSTNTSGTIIYSSSDESIATIVDNKVHIVKPGTVTIYADQSADANYNAAGQQSQTLTIDKKDLTLTLNATPAITRSYTGLAGATLVDGNYSLAGISGTDEVTVSGSATYDNQNAGTAKTITADTFVLAGTDKDNYTLSTTSATTTGDITPAALTITASNKTKTYGQSLVGGSGSTDFTSSGLQNSETIGSVTISYTAGAAATAAADTYTDAITASLATDGTFTAGNYDITYVAGNVTVDKADLVIAADDVHKPYGVTLTATTGVPAQLTGIQNEETVDSINITYGTGADAADMVGTYTAQVFAAAASGGTFNADNYNITYGTANLFIDKAEQTITYAALPTATYGDADFAPGATSSNTGIPITYTSSNPAVATIVADKIHIVGFGTANITAHQAGDSNYLAADDAIQGLTVDKAALTITADNQQKAYGAALPTLTLSYSGFVNAETEANLTTQPIPATTATTASPVNTYAITASGAASNNYSISYVAGTLTVDKVALTITADNQRKAYGAALPALTLSYAGFVNAETEANLTTQATPATTATAASAVNTYPITASGAASNNYNISYVAGTLTVDKVALTITADNKSKNYGAALPALTLSYAGFVNGDTKAKLTTQPGLTTTATAASPVNTYPITANGAASNNYNISYVAGTLSVDKVSLTITADNKSKNYGAALPALTLSYNGLVNGDTKASLATQPTPVTTATPASPANTYPITVSGAVSDNYNISYVAGTLTVGKVALTITADSKNKNYGAALPILTATYTGFVNGDNSAGLATQPTITTTATDASRVNTYAITASGAVSNNYTISYVAGKLTVDKVPLIITANNVTKLYGTANPPLTANYSGFVNGDTDASLTAQPNLTNTAGTTTAPGNYGIAVAGANSPNYTITYVNGTLTILPLSTDKLSDLAISSGTLSPAFAAGTSSYTVILGYDVERVTITASFDPTAGVTLNGTPIPNGGQSFTIDVPVGTTTATVVVTAQDGTTRTTYTLTLSKPSPPVTIVPTNILSPNGDGTNDGWVIKDIQLYPDNDVIIYNKAGREVYRKRGYDNSWKGTLNGAPLPQGTYYYVITLGQGASPIKGYITLLRSR
jgi:gliding motility-associated-like protein